jgi:hypothetical protein
MNRRALQIQAKEIRHIGVTARPWTKPLRAKGMRVGGGRLSGCRASLFTDLSLDRQRPGVQAGNRQNTGRIRHDRPPTRRGHLEVRKPRLGYWPCMTRACSGWAGTATSPKGSAGQGAAPPAPARSACSASDTNPTTHRRARPCGLPWQHRSGPWPGSEQPAAPRLAAAGHANSHRRLAQPVSTAPSRSQDYNVALV